MADAIFFWRNHKKIMSKLLKKLDNLLAIIMQNNNLNNQEYENVKKQFKEEFKKSENNSFVNQGISPGYQNI